MFKNPYLFDFLSLGEEARERDVEKALIQHLKKFMLELGRGFAYVGNQYNLDVGGDDYFLDLLFYNTRLHCFIVFELKVGDFKPEFAGKLNFYLNTVDGQIKAANENPTIGILLCKTPNKTVIEYALRGIGKPMGVADYELEKYTPEQLGPELPTIQELEEELEKEIKVINEQLSPVEIRLRTLKEKLKNIKGDEIQIPATFPIVHALYEEGLKPLYKELIEQLSVFDTEFQSKTIAWNCTNKRFTSIDQLDGFWSVEENTRSFKDFNFEYVLFGFKKAGTENYNEQLILRLEIDTYWYGFTLQNYNNQQSLLKRLYHQPLTATDRQTVVDAVLTKVMDKIDWIIEEMTKQ